MKIIHYIKSLTKSNCGMSNMGDRYITISKKSKFKDFFSHINILNQRIKIILIDMISNQEIEVEIIHEEKNNGELRIYGLGAYLDQKRAYPGDRILIKGVEKGNDKNLFISIIHMNNTLRFVRKSTNFEGFGLNHFDHFNDNESMEIPIILNNKSLTLKIIKLEFTISGKKKVLTKNFDLYINGTNISNQYKSSHYLTVNIDSNPSILNVFDGWQEYNFNII